MKRILFFLGTLAAVALTANPAMAQTISVYGGAGFPSSTAFNDAYNAGLNVGVGVGIPLSSQFEGVVRGTYDRFSNDLSGLDDFSSYSATANLKLNAPTMNARLMPYALGGGGLFRLGVEDAFETEFGLQFGAGVGIRTSPRTNLTIEPNYVLVFNENENTQYFPVRFGASFRL